MVDRMRRTAGNVRKRNVAMPDRIAIRPFVLRVVVVATVVNMLSLRFEVEACGRLQNDRGQNKRDGSTKRHPPPPPNDTV